MTDLLRIAAAFVLIIVLLRFKWNFGLVMAASAVFLGTLYLIGPLRQGKVFVASCLDPITINLVTGLVLIMTLENIIRKRGLLKRMMEAVVNVARDRRIAMAILPGVIGLLPSAGGAAFSAPMVQEAASDVVMRPEHKAFVNYWFRHIWEYCSPLYPGIVLAAAVTQIPIDTLLLSQLPLPLAVVAVGSFLGFRDFHHDPIEGRRDRHELVTLLLTLVPIAAAVLLVVAFKLSLAIAMISVVAAMFAFYRYSPREIAATLRESFSINIVLMTAGIMVFKGMLEATGSIEALPLFFRQSGLPVTLIFFALPFIVGLLTGLTVGFVGATFPIIMAMSGGHPEPHVVTFAFASGFAGVMLSPTHLCLTLTLQYFRADMAGTYRMLYLPTLLVFLTGVMRLWI